MRNVHLLSQQVMMTEQAIKEREEAEKQRLAKLIGQKGIYRVAIESDSEQPPEEPDFVDSVRKFVRDKYLLLNLKFELFNAPPYVSLKEYKDLGMELVEEVFKHKGRDYLICWNIASFSPELHQQIAFRIIERGHGSYIMRYFSDFQVDKNYLIEKLLGHADWVTLRSMIRYREHLSWDQTMNVVNKIIEQGGGDHLFGEIEMNRLKLDGDLSGVFLNYLRYLKKQDPNLDREFLEKEEWGKYLNGINEGELIEIFGEEKLKEEIVLEEEDFLEVRELKT